MKFAVGLKRCFVLEEVFCAKCEWNDLIKTTLDPLKLSTKVARK